MHAYLFFFFSFPQILRGTQNPKKVKNSCLGAKYRSWGGCQSLQQRAVAPTFTDLLDLETLVIKRSERLSQVGLIQEYQKRMPTFPCSSCRVGSEIPFPTSSCHIIGYVSSQGVALGKTILSNQLLKGPGKLSGIHIFLSFFAPLLVLVFLASSVDLFRPPE